MRDVTRNISTERAVRNVLAVWYRRNDAEEIEGSQWYANAHDTARRIAMAYNVPVDLVAIVLAHLSPNNKWHRNVTDADNLICAFMTSDSSIDAVSCCTYSANKGRAVDALQAWRNESDPWNTFGPRAHKTRAFAKGIAYPGTPTRLVIDGHAWNIATGTVRPLTDVPTLTARGRYGWAEEVYRRAAKLVGVDPQTLQATTWLTWRREVAR